MAKYFIPLFLFSQWPSIVFLNPSLTHWPDIVFLYAYSSQWPGQVLYNPLPRSTQSPKNVFLTQWPSIVFLYSFLLVAKYCNPLSFLTQWPSIAFRSCCSTGAWDGESSRNTAANNALKYSYFTFTYAYWIARSTRGFYHSSDFNEAFCHKSSGPNQPWIYKAQDVKDNNQSSLNRWFGVRCINKEVNASLSEQRRCQQVFPDLISWSPIILSDLF